MVKVKIFDFEHEMDLENAVNEFLCQDVYEKLSFEESLERLQALFED